MGDQQLRLPRAIARHYDESGMRSLLKRARRAQLSVVPLASRIGVQVGEVLVQVRLLALLDGRPTPTNVTMLSCILVIFRRCHVLCVIFPSAKAIQTLSKCILESTFANGKA